MDLVQLRRFLVSAELGSFGKAARQLNVTQPALTQSIKSLEAMLGEDVFIRGARGVKLTTFGTLLVPRAQLIVNETNRIRDDIVSLKGVKNAKIVVGVAPYLSKHIFPEALNAFISKLPQVSLKVISGQSADLARMLVINEIDLAFCGYNEVFAHDQVLRFEALCKQKYKLVVRGGHPVFAQTQHPTISDLATYRWVVYDHEPTIQKMNLLFKSLEMDVVPDFIKTNSLSAMTALTLRTDAVSLLPADYVADEIKRQELRIIASPKLDVVTESGVLSRRDVQKTAAVKQLIALLSKTAADFER